MKLYGCAMTSPHAILEHFKGIGITPMVLTINDSFEDKAVASKALEAGVVLLLTYQDFKKNLEVLNKKKFKDLTVILFSPVVRFRDIRPIKMVDVVTLEPKLSQPYHFKEPDLTFDVKKGNEAVLILNEPYLPLLIDNALSGSILTHLMTYLYRIPNAKVQNEYRDKVIGWIVYGDDSPKTLKGLLSTIKQVEVRKGLYDTVRDNIIYKEVFKHIAELNANKKPVSYAKIAKKFDVNDFDLRYMVSIASKIDFGEQLKDKDIKEHFYSHDRNSARSKSNQNAGEKIVKPRKLRKRKK